MAIHVQNNHVGSARDEETLNEYAVIGRTREELNKIMYAYRQLCLTLFEIPFREKRILSISH